MTLWMILRIGRAGLGLCGGQPNAHRSAGPRPAQRTGRRRSAYPPSLCMRLRPWPARTRLSPESTVPITTTSHIY